MPKYLSIQIPEPCHENWDNMTATDKGRHCKACAKTVIDFSVMTDAQVLRYFKKDTGNTCGRFHSNQLENDILIPKKQIPWLRYLFTITIPAFLFSMKAMAQKKVDSFNLTKMISENPLSANTYLGEGYQIYDSAAVTNKNRMTVGELWAKSTNSPQKEIKKINPICKSIFNDTALLEEVKVISFGTRGSSRFIGGSVGYSIISKSSKKSNPITKNVVVAVKKQSINIFPNPISANQKLNITWANHVEGNQIAEIFSSNGTLVQKENISIYAKTKTAFVMLKNLPTGLYFFSTINIKTGEKISKEFIVQ